jgi:adenylate cyclase
MIGNRKCGTLPQFGGVMSGTRKLAAILAADVVGYSRLMGEDEAGTAKVVRERREAATPIVRSFGGRLVKTTGDGVLLEFPSVVAAVESAIAIQKMMAERNAALPEAKRILYRVGVNLGDILIDGEDILGDGGNVAARLEGICEPGGICLSEDAYRQARGRIVEPRRYSNLRRSEQFCDTELGWFLRKKWGETVAPSPRRAGQNR